MRKKLLMGVVLILVGGNSLAYIVDGSRISKPRILSYAKSKLDNHGTIAQHDNGATYLHLPDSYNKALFHQLQAQDYQVVKHAQILVINESEAKNMPVLQELGQKISFKPLGFYTLVIDDIEYFMLAIDSPELSNIRKKYGLSEKLENRSFNLTIGTRKLTAPDELAHR